MTKIFNAKSTAKDYSPARNSLKRPISPNSSDTTHKVAKRHIAENPSHMMSNTKVNELT